MALAGLVLLAALLRIVAIDLTDATAAPAEENRLIARNLASGRGFTFTEFGVTGPTAIRGPAYPMLLAIIGPDRVRLILTINVVAGALSVIVAALLMQRLLSPLPANRGSEPEAFGAKWATPAWIAAALFAVWPTQVYTATLTQGLTLAVLLTLACLTLAWRRTPVSLIVGGLLAGLAALTEPAVALPLLLCAVVLGWRRHWPDALLFVGTAMVLIAPWLYRNSVIFGRPMPITSNFWRDAYLGNGPNATGSVHIVVGSMGIDRLIKQTRIDALSPEEYDRLKRPEPDRVRLFRDQTLQWVRDQPLSYLRLCGRRLLNAATGSWYHPIASASGCCLPFVTWVGIWILMPRYSGTVRSVVIAFAAGIIAPTVFVVSSARLMPILDIATGLAAAYVISIDLRRKSVD
jgi:hypothetical protein